jgi:hypothetical protein
MNPFGDNEISKPALNPFGDSEIGASEAVETQGLPELQDSGLLAGESGFDVAKITPSLLTSTDTNEIAQIISSNFPNVATQYQKAPDGSVYPVLTNRETGAATVINRPGISGFDVMQGLGLLAAYTPAGRATTLTGAGLKSGATGAGIETLQAASGGEFDPMTPVLDTLFGAAGQKVFDLVRASRSGSKPAEDEIKGQLKSFVSSQNFKSPYMRSLTPEQQVDELTDAIIKGDKDRLASMIEPDAGFIEAQKTLGLKEPGLPSASSQNAVYQEIEQSLKKMPGSQLSKAEQGAVVELQQKADDLITQFGGQTEKSTLSQDLKNQAVRTVDGLADQASKAYDDIAKNINPATEVDISSLKSVIDDELAQVAGRVDQLTPLEKQLMNLFDGPVTYKAIDRRRKQIGEAMSGKGGVFKDSSKAELSRWYGLLTEAQEKAAPQFAEQWKAAKSLVSKRKDLEDNMIEAYGKDLSKNFMPQFGSAMTQLSKGKTKEFDKLMRALPESRRSEVIISALNDVFTQGSRKEQQLSVAGFADWFNAINRDKALKGRVYRYLPKEMRTQIDALGKVTNGIRNAQAKAPIGGQIMANKNVMDKVIDGIGNKFLSKLPGFLGGIIEEGVKKSQNKNMDAAIGLLGDPAFVKNIKFLASNQAEKAEKRIANSKAFKEWLKTLGEQEAKTINTVGFREYLLSEEE